MSNAYPTAPSLSHEQQPHEEHLLKPAPPTYDQATAAPNVTPAVTHGAPLPPPPPPHTVVVVGPSSTNYGPGPMDMQCPYCHNFIRTRIRYKPTSRTHLIALILCLFQLYCCVCLPYCIGSCMNTAHYCGMCNHYLGSYQRG